uniref:cadherin-related family member 5-like n=1 Tax=Pristiophorus japonicus TaxID=55135 RepID=UPI00398E7978
MEVMARDHVPPQVAYMGCVTTSALRYRYSQVMWCPVSDNSFCFKTKAEVQVAQERITPIPEPSTIHLTVNDTFTHLQDYVEHFGYSIPFLPEHLTELIKAVEISQKHFYTLEQKTVELGEEIKGIVLPPWWDIGLSVEILPWIRIYSHEIADCDWMRGSAVIKQSGHEAKFGITSQLTPASLTIIYRLGSFQRVIRSKRLRLGEFRDSDWDYPFFIYQSLERTFSVRETMGTSLPLPGPGILLCLLLAALSLMDATEQVCSVNNACCVPKRRMQVDENTPAGTVISSIIINTPPVVVKNQETVPITVKENTLQLTKAIDFENLTTPVIIFHLSCGNPPAERALELLIMNINDNPPKFPENVLNFNISELFPVDKPFKTVKAFDPDGDLIFYSLDPGTNGFAYFRLRTPNTPEIILSKMIPYEETKTLQLKLHAKEKANDINPIDTVTINIHVLDEDNKPPVFEPCVVAASSAARICVNAAYTGRITRYKMEPDPLPLSPQRIQAVDGDKGINATITYSIIAGDHDKAFKIDATSGELTMTKAVTSPNPIVLTVLAYQLNDHYKYSTTIVTINVLNASRCSPNFEKPHYDGIIQGDVEPDSIVIGLGSTSKPLAVQAKDCDYPKDINPSIRYEIIPSDYFTINRDGFIFTNNKLPPADSMYDLMVKATDDEYGVSTTTKVTVKIINNNAPTTVKTTTTHGTGPPNPPTNPPGPGPTTTGASTPSKVPPGPSGTTTAKTPGSGSGPTTAPTTVKTTTTHGTGPPNPPTNPPGPGPTSTGVSTPSKVPPGPPGSTTAKTPGSGPTITHPSNSPVVTEQSTTHPHLSRSTTTAQPGPPGLVTSTPSKVPNGSTTGPITMNPRLAYEAKHMVALGVPLAVLLIICLIIIAILLYKIHVGKMEWEKIKERSSAKIKAFARGTYSSTSDKLQFTNEGFQEDENPAESQKSRWPSEKSAPVAEVASLAAVLDPPVENSSSTRSSGEQTGPRSPRTVTAPTSHEDSHALGSLPEADDDPEVKSILTKERKNDEGYKSVWFKEDIEPEANEEHVIARHGDEEEAEEEEGDGGDSKGGGVSFAQFTQDDALSITL